MKKSEAEDVKKKNFTSLGRREFLRLAVGGAVLTQIRPGNGEAALDETSQTIVSTGKAETTALSVLPARVERHWLGQNFWGNRLQDWRLAEGRIECVHQTTESDLRTVSLLTREIVGGKHKAGIRATMGRVSQSGNGFCGFLIGAGAGKLDYRAAALVQRSSGVGGGLLCVFGSDGRTAFREHTSEDAPFLYEEIPAEHSAGDEPYRGGDITLSLDIEPNDDDDTTFNLTLKAEEDGQLVSTSRLAGVNDADLVGGVMLVSASNPGPDSARFWFRDVETSGHKIACYPERALGPILGTLYSVNRNVMKMTAQFMPIADTDPQDVTLFIAEAGSDGWREVASQKLGAGYSATFRVEGWDDSKDWKYRVHYANDGYGVGRAVHYEGVIGRDPRHSGEQLTIGLYSCTMAVARLLDKQGGELKPLPQSQELGRYAPQSMYFPFSEILTNSLKHKPDMAVFAGDQFYEGNPTRKVPDEAPLLDYLYKYYLWLWSFRELTRNRPTLVLIDDHDVYQGNVWGAGGRKARDRRQELGGYTQAASWVNMVQKTQCGHNPDPWDPRPVEQGIGVYYCAFSYGDVEFAMVEDRKWKSPPPQDKTLHVNDGVLLGERQEQFLAEWGKKTRDAEARIVLTQTLWGCVQTNAEGKTGQNFDSNGYPPAARNRAVKLVRDANAILLGADQHLATVTRLGVDDFTDGPVQFTGPAGHANWTRWFMPADPLPNPGNTPHTGDFTDAFGHKIRVMAVANPRITFQEFKKHSTRPEQDIGDRNLKSDGYGIVRVDRAKKEYTLECWRWDVNPEAPGAKQYPGWPVIIAFDKAGRA